MLPIPHSISGFRLFSRAVTHHTSKRKSGLKKNQEKPCGTETKNNQRPDSPAGPLGETLPLQEILLGAIGTMNEKKRQPGIAYFKRDSKN